MMMHRHSHHDDLHELDTKTLKKLYFAYMKQTKKESQDSLTS